MWIDERGSEVLQTGECRRLLALGVKNGHHGHLGIPQEGAPLVLPVNYLVNGSDVLVRLGELVFEQVEQAKLVSFQVDGVDVDRPWSVLVRGLATEVAPPTSIDRTPVPEVADPGHRIVSIRGDMVTGRLLGAIPAAVPYDVTGSLNSI